MVTYFTDLIYSVIRYAVTNGDISPIVGHNVILRLSALQAVSYVDEDGHGKIWSESHVSEYFEMPLRLQWSIFNSPLRVLQQLQPKFICIWQA